MSTFERFPTELTLRIFDEIGSVTRSKVCAVSKEFKYWAMQASINYCKQRNPWKPNFTNDHTNSPYEYADTFTTYDPDDFQIKIFCRVILIAGEINDYHLFVRGYNIIRQLSNGPSLHLTLTQMLPEVCSDKPEITGAIVSTLTQKDHGWVDTALTICCIDKSTESLKIIFEKSRGKIRLQQERMSMLIQMAKTHGAFDLITLICTEMTPNENFGTLQEYLSSWNTDCIKPILTHLAPEYKAMVVLLKHVNTSRARIQSNDNKCTLGQVRKIGDRFAMPVEILCDYVQDTYSEHINDFIAEALRTITYLTDNYARDFFNSALLSYID